MSTQKQNNIYIIEDDQDFSSCISRYISKSVSTARIFSFSNVIDAIQSIDEYFPDLIFLDVLLTGPDGFTLLNELASYPDTARIPIVIISSIDFKGQDLSSYGVVATLNKDNLTPQEVIKYAKQYSH